MVMISAPCFGLKPLTHRGTLDCDSDSTYHIYNVDSVSVDYVQPMFGSQTSNNFFGWGSFGVWPSANENNNMENGRHLSQRLRFRDFSPYPMTPNVLDPPAKWIRPQSMIRQCDMLDNFEGLGHQHLNQHDQGRTLRELDQKFINNNTFPTGKLTLRLREQESSPENAKRKNIVEIPIMRINTKSHSSKNSASSQSIDEDSLSDYENLEDTSVPVEKFQSVKLHESSQNTKRYNDVQRSRGTINTSRPGRAVPVLAQGLPVAQGSSRFYTNSAVSPRDNHINGAHAFEAHDFPTNLRGFNDPVIVGIDKNTQEPYFTNNYRNHEIYERWMEESDFVMLDDDSNDARDASSAHVDLTREEDPKKDQYPKLIGVPNLVLLNEELDQEKKRSQEKFVDLTKERKTKRLYPNLSGVPSLIVDDKSEGHRAQADMQTRISNKARTSNEPSIILLDDSQNSSHITVSSTNESVNDESIAVISETQGQVQRHKPRYFQQIEEDILSSDMLSDEAINLGQNLLHRQYPDMGGLEDTSIGAVYNFSERKTGAFIQILHDMSCHWVCVSNIGCLPGEVNLYDTLYYGIIKPAIQKQITCIMKPLEKYLKVNVQPIQKQQNSTDCGVFTLAFATSLLEGKDPTKLLFDVSQLRPHLMSCLEDGKMTSFPTICEEGSEQVLDLVEHIKPDVVKVALVCSCRAPFNANDKSDDLVACKSCGVFYHLQCESIPFEALELDIDWHCSNCRQYQ